MPGTPLRRLALPAAALTFAPMPALAAPAGPLGLGWGLPFAGLLLSIALMPLFAARLWHHHYGKIAALWVALLLLPFGLAFGAGASLSLAWHILLQEYLPFTALLLALYTTGGGVL